MSAPDHAHVPFPPPLLFLTSLLLALGLNVLTPTPVTSPQLMHALGALAGLTGLTLAWWAVSSMRRAHTPLDPGRPVAALVTTGPFRFSRNPIYLGFTLIILGLAFIAGTWWGLILTPLVLLLATRIIVRAEEAYLRAAFGERYRAYVSRVRRWI